MQLKETVHSFIPIVIAPAQKYKYLHTYHELFILGALEYVALLFTEEWIDKYQS